MILKKDNRKEDRKNNSPAPHQQTAIDPTLVDASLSGWFKQETGELIEGFRIAGQDVVLDVGCGDSPFLHFCAKQGAKVMFADIDPIKVAAMKIGFLCRF